MPITIKNFSTTFLEDVIYFQVMGLTESYFVWVGTDQAAFQNLSMAIPSPHDPVPIIMSLLSKGVENQSDQLARLLTQKTKKQCFASCNLPENSDELFAVILKKVAEEIKALEKSA